MMGRKYRVYMIFGSVEKAILEAKKGMHKKILKIKKFVGCACKLVREFLVVVSRRIYIYIYIYIYIIS